MTGAECTRCGDCCDDIFLSSTFDQLRAQLETSSEFPRIVADAEFILAHWTVARVDDEGSARYACDRFDPVARLCAAHDERPPVCSEFPWYGKEPSAATAERLPVRCAFRADAGVPVELGKSRVPA